MALNSGIPILQWDEKNWMLYAFIYILHTNMHLSFNKIFIKQSNIGTFWKYFVKTEMYKNQSASHK